MPITTAGSFMAKVESTSRAPRLCPIPVSCCTSFLEQWSVAGIRAGGDQQWSSLPRPTTRSHHERFFSVAVGLFVKSKVAENS